MILFVISSFSAIASEAASEAVVTDSGFRDENDWRAMRAGSRYRRAAERGIVADQVVNERLLDRVHQHPFEGLPLARRNSCRSTGSTRSS